MGVRAHDRNMKHLSGQYIRRADTSANHGSSRPVKSGVRPLGPAKTEFHDTSIVCRINDAGGLGGYEGLMVDNI